MEASASHIKQEYLEMKKKTHLLDPDKSDSFFIFNHLVVEKPVARIMCFSNGEHGVNIFESIINFFFYPLICPQVVGFHNIGLTENKDAYSSDRKFGRLAQLPNTLSFVR